MNKLYNAVCDLVFFVGGRGLSSRKEKRWEDGREEEGKLDAEMSDYH